MKRAWQAQILSYTLVTLGNNRFFQDNQMILVSFFHISTEWGRFELRTNSEKSKKVKRAWQAQISSHTLATLRKNRFFKDIWMVLLSFFDIFNTCPTITSICSTGTYWTPCMRDYCIQLLRFIVKIKSFINPCIYKVSFVESISFRGILCSACRIILTITPLPSFD